MSCCCDADPPEAFVSETRKARKAHRCQECGGPIEPGQTYRHVWGVWRHEPATWKTCPSCLDLETWVLTHGDGCHPCLGDLLEESREELRNAMHCTRAEWWAGARLLIAAERRLQARHDELCRRHAQSQSLATAA